MYKKYLALSAMAAIAQAENATSDHWAVIVAGSNGFGNYRHQADTCHAYQIMKKNGIPEDQIIHLSYDDVANSRYNPFPGKLFNKPTPAGTPGVDVYEGCKIDYSGSKTTAANVINVLKGDAKAAGGPVLKSNENSKVFFYFADHGAPGLIAMPTGGYLYADKFHEALKFMYDNKMYKEMVVYIEACESGSMFENILENNLNIYAVSAANSHESSWGTYCSPNDKVDGKSVGSCLGDLFSVNWLEDSDKGKMTTETLQTQFNTVQKETDKSHVLQWGQLTFTSEPIGDFQSGNVDEEKDEKMDFWHKLKQHGKKFLKDAVQWDEHKPSTWMKNEYAVDSRDVQLHYLYNRVMTDATPENHQALQAELDHRMKVDAFFAEVFPQHIETIKKNATPLPTEFDCYRKLVDTYEENCEKMDDYSLKWMKAFVAECEGMKSFPAAIEETVNRITKACTKQ